ncbi:hypothetical protein CN933_22270 [Sinorhizobium sp. M4_45]|nr:hypothetical protein CN933_22270 [Sinorhizobium sp. M4_45]
MPDCGEKWTGRPALLSPTGRGRGNGLRYAALQFDGNNMDGRDERHYPLVDGRSPHRHYPALYVRLLTARYRESSA